MQGIKKEKKKKKKKKKNPPKKKTKNTNNKMKRKKTKTIETQKKKKKTKQNTTKQKNPKRPHINKKKNNITSDQKPQHAKARERGGGMSEKKDGAKTIWRKEGEIGEGTTLVYLLVLGSLRIKWHLYRTACPSSIASEPKGRPMGWKGNNPLKQFSTK